MVKFFSTRPWNYRLMHPITNPFVISFSFFFSYFHDINSFTFILETMWVYCNQTFKPRKVFITFLSFHGPLLYLLKMLNIADMTGKERGRTRQVFSLLLNVCSLFNAEQMATLWSLIEFFFIIHGEMNLLTDTSWALTLLVNLTKMIFDFPFLKTLEKYSFYSFSVFHSLTFTNCRTLIKISRARVHPLW